MSLKLRWLMPVALCLACAEDSKDDTPEADMAVTVDMAVAPDAEADAAEPDPDAAEPDPDAGPDRCAQACDQVADCAVDQCDGHDAAGRDEIQATCAGICANNAAFATVVLGAANCETVVEFAIDNLGETFVEGCSQPREIIPDPDPASCPWPCEGDEVCSGGHCVRPDGSCDTDYHCVLGQEECLEGACSPVQFAECENPTECAPGMSCRSFSQDPLAPGNCYIDCEADDVCPINEYCLPDLGICYFAFCGPGSPNGTVYEGCTVAGQPGTCYPLPEGNRNNAGVPGICIDAGTAENGAPCDSQAEERTPEDADLRCVPGSLCFGDPDDPREPGAPLDNLGECVELCDPRAPECEAGFACINYSNGDDPATPNFDDTRYVGVCQASDCDIFDPEMGCADGQACRVLGVLQTAGMCTVEGEGAIGDACETAEDCAGNTFCGNNGQVEQACIALCEPDVEDSCGPGFACFVQEERWVVGFCVPTGEPIPDPDAGVGDPDMGAADAGVEADAAPGDMGVEGDAEPADAGAPDAAADGEVDAGVEPDRDAGVDAPE